MHRFWVPRVADEANAVVCFVRRQKFGRRVAGGRGAAAPVLHEKSAVQAPAGPPVVAEVHAKRPRRARSRGRDHGRLDRHTASHSVRQRGRIASAGEECLTCFFKNR